MPEQDDPLVALKREIDYGSWAVILTSSLFMVLFVCAMRSRHWGWISIPTAVAFAFWRGAEGEWWKKLPKAVSHRGTTKREFRRVC